DEPTNHLDIDSKEVFEDALMDFPGTSIIISHDRYLLSKVPTRIMELEAGGIKEYLGRYDYYVDKKERMGSGTQYLEELGAAAKSHEETGEEPAEKLSPAEERRLKKEAEAEERRKAREMEQLEKDIENLEIRIHEIEEEMCTEEVLSDYLRLDALNEELSEAKEQLTNFYQKWLQ
ncbi:MAG: ABC-F family ATP-binding cassette domain-containing protein, partial [Firmicutes bacterium]|nr:ABC-F family ATP-binding cassette domain-containing protein [Bacillota bacterium]